MRLQNEYVRCEKCEDVDFIVHQTSRILKHKEKSIEDINTTKYTMSEENRLTILECVKCGHKFSLK